MKSTKLLLILLVIFQLSFYAQNVNAGDQYFWLFRILPSLKTIARAMVRVSLPATGTQDSLRAVSFDLNHLTSNSGSPTSVGRHWNIDTLMNQHWPSLPQQFITIDHEGYLRSREHRHQSNVQASPHSHRQLMSLLIESSPLSFLPMWYLATSPGPDGGCLFADLPDLTPPQQHQPLEVVPAGSANPLIQSLQVASPVVSPDASRQLPLHQAINDALPTHYEGVNNALHPLTGSLLLALTHSRSRDGQLYVTLPLGAHLFAPHNSIHAEVIVPHNTLLNLGLIPGADRENEKHANPDSWGDVD